MPNRAVRMIALLTALVAPTGVGAAPVELALVAAGVKPGAMVARAEFRPGDPDKPVVLLLHGFLQTHDFPIIHQLAEGLASEGYGVLAPTLTLGVTHRRQSLACEAVHTHDMDGATAEISAWIDWLKALDPKAIVLVGHSLGSINLLAYAAGRPDPAVRKFIGISIIEGIWNRKDVAREHEIARLRERIRAGDRAPASYPFSFCKTFRAAPDSLLSYLEWTPDRILKTASRTRAPFVFIMGGRDERLGPDWLDRLRATRARVRVIEGANHFMDGAYEFDLLDHLVRELRATPR